MTLRLDEAIDLYLGDLARAGRTRKTLDAYRRKLDVLAGQNERREVTEVGADECRRALDRWTGRAPGTLAHSVTVYNGFFGWLYREGKIEHDPMQRIARPRLPKPEELDVASLTADEVRRLIAAVQTQSEALCIALGAYLGPRRGALARLRWADVDFERGTIRFREKGRKVISKPMPHELELILRRAAELAEARGGSWRAGYVIPGERAQTRDGERDDRVIWRLYKRVAARAGVGGHVHALRAAFAVHFLESKPGDLEALQALLGHRNVQTTQVYLRKLNRERAMERVRDLSWQSTPFEAYAAVGERGFEPL